VNVRLTEIIQCGQCQTYEESEPVFGIGEFILFSDIPIERRPERQCPQCRAKLSDWEWVALDPTDSVFRAQRADLNKKLSTGRSNHLVISNQRAKEGITKQRQKIEAELNVF